MPIFEYRCSACQHLEEVLQKHSDPAPEVCPKCGKTQTLAKELSLTSFQLKGGGWYKDLYSSTKKDSGGSSDGGSSSGGSSSSAPSSSSSTSSTPAPPAAPAAAPSAPTTSTPTPSKAA
jgi:putative FmdB family regulatory protein